MRVDVTCCGCGTSFKRERSDIRGKTYCRRACMPPRPSYTSPLEFSEDGLTARIPLRNRDGSVRAYAIVDAADAEWANLWRWTLCAGRAARGVRVNGTLRKVYLHRLLLGLTWGDGIEGDHIDRNPLNCRRSNLRPVPSQKGLRGNAENKSSHRGASSQCRGVYWNKRQKKWGAQINSGGKHTYLGYFRSETDAAEAARAARARLMPFAVD